MINTVCSTARETKKKKTKTCHFFIHERHLNSIDKKKRTSTKTGKRTDATKGNKPQRCAERTHHYMHDISQHLALPDEDYQHD
ncbi:hypothetical protein [Zymobacter palmae]|uniref:hypothetical protein n=1 Tax=Zymobacter palmae TaxID=33074 RepID=UPI0011AE3472|nr:hypothetical protein [Zymobacter palmae]